MSQNLQVTIPQGTLQGTIYTSEFNQQKYCAFLGIPYAKPPIKELRFLPPEPAESWEGIRDASKEGNDCVQHCAFRGYTIGSEDCLYLNVYTPQPPSEIQSLKAVIVQIHCGANNWGSGSSMIFGAPDYIVHHDVIYVPFNFRLHILGFLNLNLPECAGNMGLKDQVMALRWVKENIRYFGGDPNNITLYGSSSGATDVHLHMMSPLSKGLYNKVILQGGYAYSRQWGLMYDPLERAFELGKILKFDGEDVKELYHFLKNQPVDMLLKGGAVLRNIMRRRGADSPASMIPSVERFEEGAFLSCPPSKLLYSVPPVPMIATLCEAEGSTVLVDNPMEIYRKELPLVIENNLKVLFKLNANAWRKVAKKIQVFYFGQNKDYESKFSKTIDLYTDMWTVKWQDMVDHQAKFAPVYLQIFTFIGKHNFQRHLFMGPRVVQGLPNNIGTLHGDDGTYFSYHKILKQTINFSYDFGPNRETKVINNMTTMFTNFAKKNDPNGNLSGNVIWKLHTPQRPCYLRFGEKLSMIDGIIHPKRKEFWRDLIKYIQEHENST